MSYKALIFDLDGTLLNDVKEIPEKNLRRSDISVLRGNGIKYEKERIRDIHNR